MKYLTRFIYVFLPLIFTGLLSIGMMSVALSANNIGNNGFVAPTELGSYKIGYTEFLVKDNSRNLIGGATATALDPLGRPLMLRVWYPSAGGSGVPVMYSLTNPIYNGVNFPGTGYPQIIFNASFPSENGTKEGVPVANGKFPVMFYAHGSGGAELVEVKLFEIMVSQGYIVVVVDSTGNDTSNTIRASLGISGAAGHSILGNKIVRAKDVSFAIDEILAPVTATKVKPIQINPANISSHVNANLIGLYGYSLGGTVATNLVAGNLSLNFPKEPRIKAAIFGDGYDGTLTSADYANVTVPTMFLSHALGVTPSIFSQLVNSIPKYVVAIAGAGHAAAAAPTLCSDIHAGFLTYQTNPLDDINYYYTSWLIGFGEYYNACEASLFDGITQNTLNDFGITDNAIFEPLMPFIPAASLVELSRVHLWYVVSFFNAELRGQNSYAHYLTDSKKNQRENPLVDFSKNCIDQNDHPMDLKAGDKITFTPDGTHYSVIFSSGNTLYDKGTETNNLLLGDDDTVTICSTCDISLPFSFPIAGANATDSIFVSANGGITNFTGFAWDGSPWQMLGELVLKRQFTIAALMVDLNPSEAGGVYFIADTNRAIITWDAVPVYSNAGGQPTNTIQVVLNANGTIEMLFGNLAGIGADYDPAWIGQIGVANGTGLVTDLMSGAVDFSTLTTSTTPSGNAIFEQFYQGNGTSCKKNGQGNGHGQ